MEKKTIIFVAYLSHTLMALVEQCHELGVSDDFHVEARLVSQLPLHPFPADCLVVLSSTAIVSMVEPYLPPGTPVIVANRMVQYTNIREMLEIPKGTKVLLVSDLKETAEETVELLKESGMDLDLYPYYPGASYPDDIEIAVTPGEAHFVPPEIRKIVDIGSRVFDLATWLEIYAHFQFKSGNVRVLTARAMQSLVFITKELNNEIQRTNLLHKNVEAIIDRIEDAVIAVDQDDMIQIINEKAMDTLHLRALSPIGKYAHACLPNDFYAIIAESKDDKEQIVEWRNKTYFFRKTEIMVEGKVFGYLVLFRKTAEIERLEHDYRLRVHSKGLVAKYRFEDICVVSDRFQKVIQIAQKVAWSNSTVLLLGETGTGKELIAQAIHNASPRAREPFVGVNFAAISETLLESELFGYEEGAFTGARKGGHIGWFERAHKGTIFLDEIGDAHAAIQNRLLRVLQERQIMRVGGSNVIPIDIRVIAATNQDLQQMVQEGTFRADLYYRLNILPIYLPPLRQRIEDIPVLAEQFIQNNCRRLRRPPFQFSSEAMRAMETYHWPGNIRELENIVEYLAHIVEDKVFPHHLPFMQRNSSEYTLEEPIEHDLRRLVDLFEEKGFLTDMIAILRLFGSSMEHGGRPFILAQLLADNIPMTDQKLRYRLKMLEEAGLIQSGRGRKGSTITRKGQAFLSFV
ncbi:sigma 54-interacting transcriptional regulator [Brevibacillus sp. TJ4]|uniref:sigma 54-interacting transcriptional regulator n=1 Tax=Brevibacillus sp. TJ4 TaxID=3234853 RepID=UPI0037D2184D